MDVAEPLTHSSEPWKDKPFNGVEGGGWAGNPHPLEMKTVNSTKQSFKHTYPFLLLIP